MAPKADQSVNGIPRWAGPWAVGWSGMHSSEPLQMQLELSSLGQREERAPVHALPKNAQRRLQTIGAVASGVAATAWLLATVWVWQIIA